MRAVRHRQAHGVSHDVSYGEPHGVAVRQPHRVAIGESLDGADSESVAQPDLIAVSDTHIWTYRFADTSTNLKPVSSSDWVPIGGPVCWSYGQSVGGSVCKPVY
jgi:hypothetical protein